MHRDTVRFRWRRVNAMLGIVAKPAEAAPPEPEKEDYERFPFPAGNRVTWGAITAGTFLQGVPYAVARVGKLP